MNTLEDASRRVHQRGRNPTEAPLPNEGKPLDSVETDECDGSYSESSQSENSSLHDQDDHAAARIDRVSTSQSDPSVPRGDESITRGTEVKRNRASSSSIVDFDKQEWSAEKPKALSSTEINQAKWDALFGRLLKYKDEFGDCLVPNRYETDPTLGAWVSTQRR
jgi:Helicase associated domain